MSDERYMAAQYEILELRECRAIAIKEIAELRRRLATLSDPTSVYRRISVADLDPGDGTVRPSFEEVLAKGFYAMGWEQPTLAAYEMIYAAAERIASDVARDLIPTEPQTPSDREGGK